MHLIYRSKTNLKWTFFLHFVTHSSPWLDTVLCCEVGISHFARLWALIFIRRFLGFGPPVLVSNHIHGPCKMKRVQARDLAGGSEISRNYAAWRASADFSVLLRDPRDLRVKGRAQSYSRRKRGTSRNYANSYLGI